MTHCFAHSSLQNGVLLKKNHAYEQINMEELHNYISERHIFKDIAELFGIRYNSLNL